MLKKLKIKARLLVCFLLVDLMVLIMAFLGLTGLKYALLNQNKLTQEIMPINTSILSCRVYANTAAAKLGEMILAEDISTYNEDEKVINELLAELNAALEFLAEVHTDGIQQEDLIEYTKLINEWQSNVSEMMNQMSQGNFQDAHKLLVESSVQRASMVQTAQKLTQDIGAIRDGMVEKSQTNVILYSWILLALLALAVISSVVLVFRLTYGIAVPLQQVRDSADEMAKGNLEISVDYEGSDELGELADSMRAMSEQISYYMGEITSDMEQLAVGNLSVPAHEPFLGDFRPAQNAIHTMVDSLNQTMLRINGAADSVAIGSAQVSDSAQALSQGATEQAMSTKELESSINEVSAHIQTNAKNAGQADRQAQETARELESGKVQMQDMTAAMARIDETSHEIGKIIKTIEDIAFQTNILALNASVEAARAGDAGKGFAVVADEVRNLAGKSAEASQTTAALIQASLEAVREGTAIATETAESLNRIVDSSEKSADLVRAITKASQEQAAAVEQVTAGITQISNVVQINSATAEESAAASEELSGMSKLLKSLVDKFQLTS